MTTAAAIKARFQECSLPSHTHNAPPKSAPTLIPE